MERRSDVTSPVFGGIGSQGTPNEPVRQARDGGSGDNGRGAFEVGGRKFLSVISDYYAENLGREPTWRPSPPLAPCSPPPT